MPSPSFTAAIGPRRRGVAALALCIGLSACNTTLPPKPSAAPDAKPASAAKTSASAPKTADCAWPCEDRSYDGLLAYVAATDPDVLGADAERRARAAEVTAAERAFGPSTRLQGRNGSGDDGPEQGQVILSVRQPVWQGGVLRGERDRAGAELERQEAAVVRTVLDVKLAFNQAYVAWRSAQEAAQAWNAALAQVDEVLPRLERSREAGATSAADFRQVALSADQILSEQLAAEGALEQARAELASYLPADLSVSLAGVAKGGYGAVSGRGGAAFDQAGIAALAPVREADARVRVAALSQEILKLARAPQVDLVAEASYEQGEAGVDDTEDAGLYLSVTSEFGAPGETRARLAGAEAAEEAARARRAAVLRETQRRLDQSREVMRDAAARASKLDAAIARAREALSSEQRSFEGLQSNGARLVSAIDRLASLQQKRADARGAYWGARWTLQIYQAAVMDKDD